MRHAAVLLRQEIHREMHAAEIAAGDRQIARLLGAAGEHDGVVAVDELLRFDVDADIHIAMELDAFGLHLRDAPLDVNLLHFKVGNAVAQQAAGFCLPLEDMHLVSGARELLRACQARRA